MWVWDKQTRGGEGGKEEKERGRIKWRKGVLVYIHVVDKKVGTVL